MTDAAVEPEDSETTDDATDESRDPVSGSQFHAAALTATFAVTAGPFAFSLCRLFLGDGEALAVVGAASVAAATAVVARRPRVDAAAGLRIAGFTLLVTSSLPFADLFVRALGGPGLDWRPWSRPVYTLAIPVAVLVEWRRSGGTST